MTPKDRIDSDTNYKQDGQRLFDRLQDLESTLKAEGMEATASDIYEVIENTGYYAAARIWRAIREDLA